MKHFFTLLLACGIFLNLEAQITIMDSTPKKPKELKYDNYVYDSLINVQMRGYNGKSSYHYLVGQTLMFCGNSDGNEYNFDDNKRSFTIGDYYKVDSVLPDDPGKGLYGRLVLTNLKTGQKTEEGSFDYKKYNYRWVVLGHYEKIKSMYVGTIVR